MYLFACCVSDVLTERQGPLQSDSISIKCLLHERQSKTHYLIVLLTALIVVKL